MGNVYGMGRDPRIFPDPQAFRPSRWLRTGEGEVPKEHMFLGSVVFGHGPRMCIGWYQTFRAL